mgnify:CR=1 FL=1
MRNIIIIGLAAVLVAAGVAYFTAPDEKAPTMAVRDTAMEKAPGEKAPGTAAVKPPLTATASSQGGKLMAPALGQSPGTSDGKVVVAREASNKETPQGAAQDATQDATGDVTGDAAGADKAVPVIKSPTFDIVRIAKDRTAVVAGRAPPGSTVRLILNGEILAETQVSRGGEWVAVIVQPLPRGQAELDLVAVMPDGKIIAAEAVVAVVIPEATSEKIASSEVVRKDGQTALAVLLPKSSDAPATLLQKPQPEAGASSSKLSVDTVDYDDKGNVIVSGSAPSGAKVRTYVDNEPVGLSQADQKSVWRLKPTVEVAPGRHTLRVDQIDNAGRVISRIELPFVRAPADEALAAIAARFQVIVQPGNSLWRIARRVYGQGDRYTVIYQANDDHIRNPDMIFPGQVFKLPVEK